MSVQGLNAISVTTGNEALKKTISAKTSENAKIFFVNQSEKTEFACISNGVLELSSDGGGEINVSVTDRCATVSVVPFNGFIFDGWYGTDNVKLDFNKGFSGNTSITRKI